MVSAEEWSTLKCGQLVSVCVVVSSCRVHYCIAIFRAYELRSIQSTLEFLYIQGYGKQAQSYWHASMFLRSRQVNCSVLLFALLLP